MILYSGLLFCRTMTH